MTDEQFTERMEGFVERQLQLVAKRTNSVAPSIQQDDGMLGILHNLCAEFGIDYNKVYDRVFTGLRARSVKALTQATQIEPTGKLLYKGHEIETISQIDAEIILDRYPYHPKGLYIIEEPIDLGDGTERMVYCAMDNSTGDAWCEDFFTGGVALRWLVGEFVDSERAHELDLEFLEKELRSTIDDPETIEECMEYARRRSL